MQRSDILQAAAQIFRLKGYHATSMQDIAAAVHLQKASLYHHVQNKQDILVSILDQALDLVIADMETVLASPAPSQDKLASAVQVYVRHLVDQRDLAAVLLLSTAAWTAAGVPATLRGVIASKDYGVHCSNKASSRAPFARSTPRLSPRPCSES